MANKSSELCLSGYPQPRQKEFFLADTKYVAYGGARGGGKSWALRRKLVLMALYYPGISVLLIRRTLPELRDNHIRPLLSELSDFCRYSDAKRTLEFPNGSRIRLGYLDKESDTLQYQGQEYDIIALDEATQLTEYQFQVLKACLRGANSFPKRMYITCNPGGVGHGWVKRLFIDRDYKDGENPKDFTFIQALVYDNKALLSENPDYLSQLQSLPDSLKSAWLYGHWDEFEGQFFPEFSAARHTADISEIPDRARRYCAIDYGLDMLAAVFVAVTEKGRCIVYDEVHESGLIVSEAAKRINEKRQGVEVFIAPSDLWSRQKDTGKSIAELFGENGIFLTRQRSDRISGWMSLRELMKYDENTEPRLIISKKCTSLIRCLPLLLHDGERSGDASTHPHAVTHAPDALRYFAVSGYADIKSSTKAEKQTTLRDKIKNRRRYNK